MESCLLAHMNLGKELLKFLCKRATRLFKEGPKAFKSFPRDPVYNDLWPSWAIQGFPVHVSGSPKTYQEHPKGPRSILSAMFSTHHI